MEAREDTDSVLSGLAVKQKEEECNALKQTIEKKVLEGQELKSQVSSHCVVCSFAWHIS